MNKQTVQFNIDINSETTPFPHYWELCVGSCHAYMGLRDDWRRQLKRCRDELGFRYVRFHGLFNDDMSVCIRERSPDGKAKGLRYSFFNIDSIFDFLVEIGMKPFIELGFMPEALASGTQTCFHYKANVTPPSDYSEWEELVRKLTEHLVDRYGVDEVRTWFFEVWNEPNLNYFWSGTQEEYFRLYKHSADAIKSVDSKLRVGGPATSVNAWIPDMIGFCRKTGTPLDYISTHHYPTDDPLWRNNDISTEEFFAKFADEFGDYERGVLYKMTAKAKAEAGDIPLYYTEWNSSAVLPDPVHDVSYTAALIAKTIADNDGMVECYSFWTFSDLFEEAGQFPGPFHGGFGLQTIHGIPKPSYRVFELLHYLGDRRLKVEGDKDDSVEMLATMQNGKISLLAYNHNVPGADIDEKDICIALKGIGRKGPVIMTMINDESANPKKKWVELGSPEYPNKEELETINRASVPAKVSIEPEHINGDCIIRFKIPPHGIVGVTI